MWDTINTAILSLGLSQFLASLVPNDPARLRRDPISSGFPLRYLLTGGHPLLFPLFFCMVYAAFYLKLTPAALASYAAKAGAIGGIILSVLSILLYVRSWYRRARLGHEEPASTGSGDPPETGKGGTEAQ